MSPAAATSTDSIWFLRGPTATWSWGLFPERYTCCLSGASFDAGTEEGKEKGTKHRGLGILWDEETDRDQLWEVAREASCRN